MNRMLCPMLALSCATPTLAGQIDRAWVDPDAAWVMHLDLEGFFGSRTFRTVTDLSGIDPRELEREMHIDLEDELEIDGKEIPPHVLEAWRNLDFTVTEDIRSLTVFGGAGHEEPDLVILRTSDAIDEIVATLDPIEGVNVAEGDSVSFVALRPVTEGGEPAMPDQVLAIRREPLNERTVVVADSTQRLLGAMESHAARSLEIAAGEGAAPDRLEMRPGSFLLVHIASDAIDGFAGEHDGSRILQKARDIRIEAGESAGDVYVEAMVGTPSVDVVNQITAVANGLMAMGRLALTSEQPPQTEHVIRLMNGISITTQDTTMHVRFRMASDALAETLGALRDLEDAEHDDGANPEGEGGDGEERVEIHIHSDVETNTYSP